MESIKNHLMPEIATIKKIIQETPNIVSLQVALDDNEAMKNFSFEPGQVAQISVFGFGESTFVINSTPSNKDYLQFSIMKSGVNTTAIHNLSEGEKVGIRAPLGNSFPYKRMEGKNILFIGGGIGMAPLRPLIFHALENKEKYMDLTLLCAAKSPDDFCFKYDLEEWSKSKDIALTQTIDNSCYGWDKEVGLCPNVLEKMYPSHQNTVAVLCGPPIMMKFATFKLLDLGFKDANIYLSMEKNMSCGIGKCGHCRIGPYYACKDGPVFTYDKIKELPNIWD